MNEVLGIERKQTFFLCLFFTRIDLLYNWKSVLFYNPQQFTHLPPLATTNLFFVLYLWVWTFVFVFLDPIYKWDHRVFAFLCLISFSIILLNHPHCYKGQAFLLLWLKNTPFYKHITHFPYSFTCQWILGYFYVLTIVGNAAVNMGVQGKTNNFSEMRGRVEEKKITF